MERHGFMTYHIILCDSNLLSLCMWYTMQILLGKTFKKLHIVLQPLQNCLLDHIE